jgi:hypothetical protein
MRCGDQSLCSRVKINKRLITCEYYYFALKLRRVRLKMVNTHNRHGIVCLNWICIPVNNISLLKAHHGYTIFPTQAEDANSNITTQTWQRWWKSDPRAAIPSETTGINNEKKELIIMINIVPVVHAVIGIVKMAIYILIILYSRRYATLFCGRNTRRGPVIKHRDDYYLVSMPRRIAIPSARSDRIHMNIFAYTETYLWGGRAKRVWASCDTFWRVFWFNTVPRSFRW